MNKVIDRATETEISEIFSSIQGEGPYLGVRQIFTRFGRCNMHCAYCDELPKMEEGRYEVRPLESVLGEIDRLEQTDGPHHSVSLTGGEPLFYPAFLESLMPKLKERGFKTYLETNGTLPGMLERVIRFTDVIAMDWKPASSTGDRAFEAAHGAFLRLALQKEVFVKVVITPSTAITEVMAAVRAVAAVSPRTPFVFQPVSEAFGVSVEALKLIETKLFPEAQQHLSDVRVIPQMHKIWNVR
jgi:organic radical activating enzyme